MTDLVLIAVTLAFVTICVAYINWCDQIIGPDDFGPAPIADAAESAAEAGEAAASSQDDVPMGARA